MSRSSALAHIRICDFTGQVAGASATRLLAAFGAQVIRIEDPTNQGRWDILRTGDSFLDKRRGVNLGGSFNSFNVEKLGITLNLRTERGRELFERLLSISDAVTENFAAGVMGRMGYPYERMREIKKDIVYVSGCGFGHAGPYVNYKAWGPTVQALSGLTFSSGFPGMEPAGWGYSYMDVTAGHYMAMALLMAMYHRAMTGEGQWIDYSSIESAITMNGPALLDYTVNGRPLRRDGMPDTNHSKHPAMAPHYIYPADASDTWVAIACRDDSDWQKMADVIGEDWAKADSFRTLKGRLEHEAELDGLITGWTSKRDKFATAGMLQAVGVPAAPVKTPEERIEHDEVTQAWALWPAARHTEMGWVRVDGVPVHMSETDWDISHGGPCLGEHNLYVYGALLGLSDQEIADLKAEGTI